MRLHYLKILLLSKAYRRGKGQQAIRQSRTPGKTIKERYFSSIKLLRFQTYMHRLNRKAPLTRWPYAIVFGMYLSSANALTLCEPQESVLFSCVLKNAKTVSICVELDEKKSHVEYRFGKPAEIELKYRADDQNKGHAFHRASILYGNNTFDTIWFKNGGHLYDLSMPARGAPAVEVWKDEKILGHIECRGGWKNIDGETDMSSPFIINHGNMDASARDASWFKH